MFRVLQPLPRVGFGVWGASGLLCEGLVVFGN